MYVLEWNAHERLFSLPYRAGCASCYWIMNRHIQNKRAPRFRRRISPGGYYLGAHRKIPRSWRRLLLIGYLTLIGASATVLPAALEMVQAAFKWQTIVVEVLTSTPTQVP